MPRSAALRKPLSGAVFRASGTAALGTGPSAGVLLLASANGKSTIADNLIVADRVGVEVAGAGTAETTVSTNTIGTNKAGTAKLGSLSHGVRLDGSARSKVASNSIVTNGYDVSVAGTVAGTFTDTSYTLDAPSTAKATGAITGSDEQVTGNRLGIFSNGTKAPGSGSAGISAWSGTSRVLLQDNTVAGHSSNEISLYRGSGHQVLKNRIGVDPTGATVLGGTGLALLLGRRPSRISRRRPRLRQRLLCALAVEDEQRIPALAVRRLGYLAYRTCPRTSTADRLLHAVRR